MKTKKYDFESTKITATLREGSYLWIGFSDGTLKKCSATDISQIFFSLTPDVTSILDINLDGSYINVLVDDEDLIGIRYSITNPLTDYTEISKPSAVTQTPIKSTHNGTKWFVLLPGTESGTVAELVIFDGTTYDDTLELSDIENARAITNDGTNAYVITYTNPAKLIKIYQSSGELWSFNSNDIA